MIPRHRTNSKPFKRDPFFAMVAFKTPQLFKWTLYVSSISLSSQGPKVYYRNGYITFFTTITKVVIILGKL